MTAGTLLPLARYAEIVEWLRRYFADGDLTIRIADRPRTELVQLVSAGIQIATIAVIGSAEDRPGVIYDEVLDEIALTVASAVGGELDGAATATERSGSPDRGEVDTMAETKIEKARRLLTGGHLVVDAWLNCEGSNRQIADRFEVDDKTVASWGAELAATAGDSAPESRQHFDVWQFHKADDAGSQSYFGAPATPSG